MTPEEMTVRLKTWNDNCDWGKSHTPDQIVERTIDLTPTEIWLLTELTTRYSDAIFEKPRRDETPYRKAISEWMDVLSEKYNFVAERSRALAVPPFIKILTPESAKGARVI